MYLFSSSNKYKININLWTNLPIDTDVNLRNQIYQQLIRDVMKGFKKDGGEEPGQTFSVDRNEIEAGMMDEEFCK